VTADGHGTETNLADPATLNHLHEAETSRTAKPNHAEPRSPNQGHETQIRQSTSGPFFPLPWKSKLAYSAPSSSPTWEVDGVLERSLKVWRQVSAGVGGRAAGLGLRFGQARTGWLSSGRSGPEDQETVRLVVGGVGDSASLAGPESTRNSVDFFLTVNWLSINSASLSRRDDSETKAEPVS